jgi:hypothetical protein
LQSNGEGGLCNSVAFPAVSPQSLQLVYNGYFETLSECQSQVNFQITSVTADSSGGTDFAVFEADTGVGTKVSLAFPGGLNGCTFTPETLYNFLEAKIPNMNQKLCEPWESNPPLQCSQLETLSPLSILSQSLSVATGCLSLLIVIAKWLLSNYIDPIDEAVNKQLDQSLEKL